VILSQSCKFLTSLCIVIVLGVISPRSNAHEPLATASQNATVARNISTSALWRDRGDIESLNLFYGAGSPDLKPAGNFTFVKELTDGATPKFEVVDQQGVHWIAKLGDEAQSETAATRLLWAAGYFTDEAYYVPELRVGKLPKLIRGSKFVSEDGVVQGVRMEPIRSGREKLGDWNWTDNRFEGTREMNGLRIMMALINNWDLKKENNAIYSIMGETQYIVSDLGGSFGKTGGVGSRSKSRVDHYINSKFIEKTASESVDLRIKSRPFFLLAVDPYHYNKLASREKVGKEIPRADARWLGELLGRLSIEQIRDCFRAAGYFPEEVDGFANIVQARITELNRL
jgi:hypothetical protein